MRPKIIRRSRGSSSAGLGTSLSNLTSVSEAEHLTASAVSYRQTLQDRQDQLSRPPVRRGSIDREQPLTPNIILSTPSGLSGIREEQNSMNSINSSNNHCMNYMNTGCVIVKWQFWIWIFFFLDFASSLLKSHCISYSLFSKIKEFKDFTLSLKYLSFQSEILNLFNCLFAPFFAFLRGKSNLYISALFYIRNYGCLWWPIFSPFGYGRLCMLEPFGMTNIWNEICIEFCMWWLIMTHPVF